MALKFSSSDDIVLILAFLVLLLFSMYSSFKTVTCYWTSPVSFWAYFMKKVQWCIYVSLFIPFFFPLHINTTMEREKWYRHYGSWWEWMQTITWIKLSKIIVTKNQAVIFKGSNKTKFSCFYIIIYYFIQLQKFVIGWLILHHCRSFTHCNHQFFEKLTHPHWLVGSFAGDVVLDVAFNTFPVHM